MPRRPEQFKEIREKTKRQILDAGLKVFAVKGYHGASIADIANEAGISKGLAYNYFGSKRELAEAVVHDLERVMSQFDSIFDASADPYEIIHYSIKASIRQVKDNEQFWLLYINFMTQVEMSGMAKKVFGRLVEKYIKLFTSMFKKIGVKNPKMEAYILASILDGVPFDYLFDKENYPINAVEKQLLRKYSRETFSKLK